MSYNYDASVTLVQIDEILATPPAPINEPHVLAEKSPNQLRILSNVVPDELRKVLIQDVEITAYYALAGKGNSFYHAILLSNFISPPKNSFKDSVSTSSTTKVILERRSIQDVAREWIKVIEGLKDGFIAFTPQLAMNTNTQNFDAVCGALLSFLKEITGKENIVPAQVVALINKSAGKLVNALRKIAALFILKNRKIYEEEYFSHLQDKKKNLEFDLDLVVHSNILKFESHCPAYLDHHALSSLFNCKIPLLIWNEPSLTIFRFIPGTFDIEGITDDDYDDCLVLKLKNDHWDVLIRGGKDLNATGTSLKLAREAVDELMGKGKGVEGDKAGGAGSTSA